MPDFTGLGTSVPLTRPPDNSILVRRPQCAQTGDFGAKSQREGCYRECNAIRSPSRESYDFCYSRDTPQRPAEPSQVDCAQSLGRPAVCDAQILPSRL